jgi:hypothetical protein
MRLIVFLFLGVTYSFFGQFVNVAAATNSNHGNNKDGGVAFADFNNDGCLDLVFNTNHNNTANRTRILFSDCNLPNPVFTDNTNTHAVGLRNLKCERSISVGDYNNDGYIDIARNTHTDFEVYLNKGPGATPPYSFGDATQNANFSENAVPGGTNIEGFGWMDYNNDGWLDLVLENHEYGIDIYENPADGSANFFHVTPNGATLGFPTGCAGSSSCAGDYMVLGDYNDDGFVDILARKEDSNNPDNDFDLWTNSGAGTFAINNTFNQDANGSNKGGVLFCDFDNDGDFDIFWSDNGTNEIFEQTGLNSGVFAATNEPETSSGLTISNTIDGCDCGDVDNDGDLDLFLGGSNAANSYLFENNGGGSGVFNFTRNNNGIAPGGNTEGLAFADYDNDGDLDLYINRNGGANELWRNSENSNDYLKVEVKRDIGGGVFRDDLGATLILKDCNGTVVSGIRQVSSVKGHGSNAPAVTHFGLNTGPAAPYLLEVRFTSLSGVRLVLDSVVVPNTLTNNTITIISPTPSSVMDGCSYYLPFELINFTAEETKEGNKIVWTTVSEINVSHFIIEKSTEGEEWSKIYEVEGNNNSSSINEYEFFDSELKTGLNFYRLVEVDFNNNRSVSKVVTVRNSSDITVYPSNAHSVIYIHSEEIIKNKIVVFNSLGVDVTDELNFANGNNDKITVDVSSLTNGYYIIKVGSKISKFIKE